MAGKLHFVCGESDLSNLKKKDNDPWAQLLKDKKEKK